MSEYAVICQKIDTLQTNVSNLTQALKESNTLHEERLRQLEIQTSLLEQSNKAICKDIEKQDEEIEKTDQKVDQITLLSKIFGAIVGFLSVVAAIVAIIGALVRGG
jgi:hypothetical protein